MLQSCEVYICLSKCLASKVELLAALVPGVSRAIDNGLSGERTGARRGGLRMDDGGERG